MEKLASYLKDHRIKTYEFAAMINVTSGAVSKMTTGKTRPSLDMAIAIHDATDGHVSLLDWRT